MHLNIEEYEFYIRPGVTDMRKRATGLSRIVQDSMKLAPFKKSVFLFCGKDHRKITAIVWNENGWLEISKRLECRGTFKWPDSVDQARKVRYREIVLMLKGVDIWRNLPALKPEYVN